MDWQKQWDRSSEKNLVAEQPGWSLVIPGLIFALFLGLVVRAIISPDRVKEQIQKAASNIHRDAKVSFESAYISLADGIFPELAVIVKNVQLTADVRCWMKPTIEVDEMKLPVSFFKLLSGEVFIDQIQIQEMNLSLADSYKPCENSNKAVVEASSDRVPAQTAQKESPQISKQVVKIPERNPISLIEIKKLNIHYLPLPFTSFYFDNFMIELENEKPLNLHVESSVVLSRDQVGTLGSLAKLKMDYQDGEKPVVNLDIRGSLGEGNFAIHSSFLPASKDLVVDGQMKYFPLSQIMPIIKKYRVIESDFTGKRTWISGKIKYEGKTENFPDNPVRLEALKLEGDIGEVAVPAMELTSSHPLKFKPFDIEIKSLSLNELRHLLNLEHPSKILGSLGYFNGALHVENQEKFVIRGDHLGLEFIFSNRGIRKNQVISLISGEVEFDADRWLAKIDRIRPFEGVFEGELKLKSDRQFKKVEIWSKVSELSLAPAIQSLMTGGGYFGTMGGELKLEMKNSEMESLNGSLHWDKVDIDGLKFDKLKVKISKNSKNLGIALNAQEMELARQKAATVALGNVFEELNSETILLKNPQLKVSTNNFRELSWNDFIADSSFGKFTSDGGWDNQSAMRGTLKLSNKAKTKWTITGYRNSPVIEKDAR